MPETLIVKNLLDEILNIVVFESENPEGVDISIKEEKNELENLFNELKGYCSSLIDKWSSLRDDFKIPKKDKSSITLAENNG